MPCSPEAADVGRSWFGSPSSSTRNTADSGTLDVAEAPELEAKVRCRGARSNKTCWAGGATGGDPPDLSAAHLLSDGDRTAACILDLSNFASTLDTAAPSTSGTDVAAGDVPGCSGVPERSALGGGTEDGSNSGNADTNSGNSAAQSPCRLAAFDPVDGPAKLR